MPTVGGIRIAGDVPNWREKRDILADPKAPAEGLRVLAEKLAAAGQLSDAADFLAKAADAKGLEALRRRARDEGQFFVWKKLCGAAGLAPPPAEEARALAARAQLAGRLFDARSALLAAGDAEAAAALEAEIPTALPKKPPEDKVAKDVEKAQESG